MANNYSYHDFERVWLVSGVKTFKWTIYILVVIRIIHTMYITRT